MAAALGIYQMAKEKSLGQLKDDDDRTTSMGLFNTAEAYRLSARALEQHPIEIGHAEKPVKFLYSHALELYLKALLRTKYSVNAVERFRHNIRNLVREAETLGLFVTIGDRDVFAVMVDTDALIEMRYIRTGSKTSLESLKIEDLRRTCHSVRDSVGSLLRQADVPVRR